MPSLGPLEILVVLVVALVVFGPQKLPELGRQIGRALREFQKVQDSFQNEVRSAFDTNEPPRAPNPPVVGAAPEKSTLGGFDRELPPPVARPDDGGGDDAPARLPDADKTPGAEPGGPESA